MIGKITVTSLASDEDEPSWASYDPEQLAELVAAYPAGCPPPPHGYYTQWHAWAAAQEFHGLRQSQCPACGLWRFPQELESCDHGAAAEAARKRKVPAPRKRGGA